jgi:hypothetical protein
MSAGMTWNDMLTIYRTDVQDVTTRLEHPVAPDAYHAINRQVMGMEQNIKLLYMWISGETADERQEHRDQLNLLIAQVRTLKDRLTSQRPARGPDEPEWESPDAEEEDDQEEIDEMCQRCREMLEDCECPF